MSPRVNTPSGLSAYTRRLGICAYAGMALGIMTGFVLTMLDLIEGPLGENESQLVVLWAMLAAFGWLAVMALFTIFVGYQLASVVVPALVNSVLVTLLMVLVCWATGLFEIAWLIGLVAGLVVGQLLCLLHRVFALVEPQSETR